MIIASRLLERFSWFREWGLVLLIYGAVADVRKLSDRFREEGIQHRRILARISNHAHRVPSFLQLLNFAHHDLSQHNDTAVRRR